MTVSLENNTGNVNVESEPGWVFNGDPAYTGQRASTDAEALDEAHALHGFLRAAPHGLTLRALIEQCDLPFWEGVVTTGADHFLLI